MDKHYENEEKFGRWLLDFIPLTQWLFLTCSFFFFIYIHVFLDASRNKTQRMQKQDKRPKDNDP